MTSHAVSPVSRVSLYFLALVASLLLGSSAPASPASALYGVGNRLSGWNGPQTPQTQLKDTFLDEVQPIFSSRCVACHGCFEAPCQANFQSYDGILRGFNAEPIYGSRRTRATYPTRMQDAKTLQEWRGKNFQPVVASPGEPDEADQPQNDGYRQALLYQLLNQSQQTNLPSDSQQHTPGFAVLQLLDLQSEINGDKNACVTTEHHADPKGLWKTVTYQQFIAQHPLAGMPLGLPRIDPKQADTLNSWLSNGAPGPSAAAEQRLEQPAHPEVLTAWEDGLLDQDSVRGQLAARYIYEHVYTAQILFQESPGEFYRLVRSRTRTGAIDEIVTELPYGDPGVERVYYRFQKVTRALVQKTQILWRLNAAKLRHLQALFLESAGWPANVSLPGYGSTNPFEYFAQIPGVVRSRFMIENSKTIIGAMVQGSVCIGSRATYAISDHFWIWFLRPESDVSALQPELGLKNWDALGMAPIQWQPKNLAERLFKKSLQTLDRVALVEKLGLDKLGAIGFVRELDKDLTKYGITGEEAFDAVYHFLRTVKANHTYQDAYEHTLRLWLRGQGRQGLALSDVWTGEGDDPTFPANRNSNAWLNVTRHELSATVQYGQEGGVPQSLWVLSYSNFERLYYNLVASFEEWGSMQHRLATWRGMSYIRLEAEDLAISFLPSQYRETIRQQFSRGVLGSTYNKAFFPLYSVGSMYADPSAFLHNHNPFRHDDLPTRGYETQGIDGGSAQASVDLLVAKTKAYLASVAVPSGAQPSLTPQRQEFESGLLQYTDKSQKTDGVRYAQLFPNITYLKVVVSPTESWVYSLIADRGYKAHNIVFAEDLNREPESDKITMYRGFVGAYPNAFLEVPVAQTADFLARLGALQTADDFTGFLQTWGIARNSKRFWPFFDWIHDWKTQARPENDPDEQGIVDLSQYLYFVER